MLDFLSTLVAIVSIQLVSAHALALSLNVARVFNLAHVALLGLGAYCAGLLALRLDAPFVVCLLVAAAVPAVVAVLIGLLAMRRGGDQVALLTLGLNLLLLSFFSNARSLTGGASGLIGVPSARIGALELNTPFLFGAFSFAVSVVCLWFISSFRRSRLGVAMLAQGELSYAAAALGIDASALKRLALVISGALVGIAGALSAFRIGIVAPGSFGFSDLCLLLMIVVLGGAGKFGGTTIAAITLSVLPELLRLVPIWQAMEANSGAYIQLVGALIVYAALRSFGSGYFEQPRNYV